MLEGTNEFAYAATKSCGCGDPDVVLRSDTFTQAGCEPGQTWNVYASNLRCTVGSVTPGNVFVGPQIHATPSRKMRPCCKPVTLVNPLPLGGATASRTLVIDVGASPVFTLNVSVRGDGSSVAVIVSVNAIVCGHGTLGCNAKCHGEPLIADEPMFIVPYDDAFGDAITTPGVEVVSVTMTFVAFDAPLFFSVTKSVAPSPASITPLPLPGASAALKVTISGFGRPGTPRDLIASRARMMPAPESRSVPSASMSTAVDVSAVRICAGVNNEFADLIRPAIAPACGAAADVPKNGDANPPTPVTCTPSAAVMSGFCRTMPPVDDTSPGVYGAPFA